MTGRRLTNTDTCETGNFSVDYIGYIYGIQGDVIPDIFNKSASFVSLECDSCDACLPDSNHCLSLCAVNQYIDASSNCADCDSDCSSCITFGTCSLCDDDECTECSTFNTCDVCLLTCELPLEPDCTNGVCICPDDGYYWISINQCLEFCATSFEINPDSSRCERIADTIMSLDF